MRCVDVRGDSHGAAAEINNWVAEKTNNKVTEIVSADAVDTLTRLILINAVYFKGDWLKKFDVNSTTDEDFHVSPNQCFFSHPIAYKLPPQICRNFGTEQ